MYCCGSIAVMQSSQRINLVRAVTCAAIITSAAFLLVDSVPCVYLGSLGMDIHPAWLFHAAILLGTSFIVVAGTLIWLGRSRR